MYVYTSLVYLYKIVWFLKNHSEVIYIHPWMFSKKSTIQNIQPSKL